MRRWVGRGIYNGKLQTETERNSQVSTREEVPCGIKFKNSHDHISTQFFASNYPI